MYNNNEELAREVVNELVKKIGLDLFLDIFKDRYNWFAALGLPEKDYHELSLMVNEERICDDKKKILTK